MCSHLQLIIFLSGRRRTYQQRWSIVTLLILRYFSPIFRGSHRDQCARVVGAFAKKRKKKEKRTGRGMTMAFMLTLLILIY